ncbi:MAG TPA: tetratricopeptide repeat protein [Chthoniobacterales bacterium]
MSKRTDFLLVGALWFCALVPVRAEDYAARFKQLQTQKAPDAEIEPLLNEWRSKAPNDPEGWIASANFYFNQRQVNISTKPAGKGDFTLTDKKTGKETGSISFEQDQSSVKRSAELLQEATTKFPDRLDIWCGLAFIYQESGDFDNEISVLQKMVAYAREHPTQLKWLKNQPIDEPADKFVPDKLHGYGMHYEKKENPDDDKRWFQISTLTTEKYPTYATGWNDVAGYYADLQDWQKAREALEKAHQLEPKSVGALINLGNISLQAKDNDVARKYFEEALKLEPNGEYAPEAKQALAKLKKK